MRCLWIVLMVALGPGPGGTLAQNAPPEAADDTYETAAGDNLSVDAPGVLTNDVDPDGEPLTALLVDSPLSGGVANLFDDGSFEYEPPDGFVGTDRFTYQAFDGTAPSNIATVAIVVSGTPQFATFLDETAFLDAVRALGLEATVESFEDDAVWGSVRSTIVDGNHAAPAVTSMGVRWTGNNPASQVTTSNGPPRTGAWAFYELPHGSYTTGTDCHLPGNCTDGFVARSSPRLHAVGAWLTAFFGSKVHWILDGSRVVDFGDGATLGSGHTFFGVVDPAGFHSFEVRELEGTSDDAKYIWADDFTFGTPAGITLSVNPGTVAAEVTLQWLGGAPGFAVYGSRDPERLADPTRLLGMTSGRQWIDSTASGDIFFYRVAAP